jgi:hypothetical protein
MPEPYVLTMPAYGQAGPNFIVRELPGYMSREEIILKKAADGGVYPEGLVLKLEEVEIPGNGGTATGAGYVPFDGSGEAAGILYQTTNASEGDTAAVAIVRGCEVQRAMLKFAGTLGDEQKEAAYASLAVVMITMR